jgi:putative tryptophan/tyrosine transport system substrate-binding protein
MAVESIMAGDAEAGRRKTVSVRSTRDVIKDMVASFAISDEQGARKKVLDNRQWTAVNKAGMARKTITVVWLVGLTLAAVHLAEAQQPKKVPRVGFLGTASPSAVSARVEAFRQGLRELGYVEAKSILIEYRWAEGKLDRMPDLAAELVRLKVDVIMTPGPAATRPAKEATSTIPIVMGFDNDPIGNGFVASLARPGGNITGLSSLAPEISGKQLELLKEIALRLTRVAVIGESNEPANSQSLKELELAAGGFKVQLQYLDVLV